LFHHFIGCPLLLKRLDVTTRMFGKLRPQGHAGKAGWDGILGRPMAALLPAEDTGDSGWALIAGGMIDTKLTSACRCI
jgi:hypothetical protein